MMKNAVKITFGLVFLGSAVFAQNLNDAKKAIDAEQYQKAKTILKGLTASQPSNAENYFYLGNTYLANDYVDSAKAVYDKGIAADAKEPLNYVGLGTVDLENNNAAAAKANFDKAVDLMGRKDYKSFLYIGRAYIDTPTPDYAQAIAYLEKAREKNPKDADIFLALGDAYRGQSKNSEAYSAYRTASELNKNLLRASVELGVINKNAKAFAEAEAEFKKVIAADPNYGPAYRELAETYLRWGTDETKERDAKYQQALDFYKKYMDLTDRSIESRMRYADFLVYTKKSKELEKEAQEMAKLDKANPRIYRYLGYAAYENKNYPASLQAMKDFFAKVDKKRIIDQDYLYLGLAQIKTDSVEAGFGNIKKAIELDSTNAEAMADVAKELFDARKYADAQRAYEIAVNTPGAEATLYDRLFMGLSYYFDYALKNQKGENPDVSMLTKADSALSYVIEKSPTSPDAYIYRARVKRFTDDAENPKGLMVPDYEKYIELITAKGGEMSASVKKNMIEAYSNLGAFYVKTDAAKAKGYFQKITEIDPENVYARDALKAIGGSK